MDLTQPKTPERRYQIRWRSYWWVIALGAFLGYLLGDYVSGLRPSEYQSETSVLVLPVLPAQDFGAAGGRTATELNLETEAQLVKSVRVATAAQERLATDVTPEELLSGVVVVVTENSQVLTIAYYDDNPDQARKSAQAFAESYLALRAEDAEVELMLTADVLEAQLADLEAQLREASDRAAALPTGTPERSFAEAQRAILVSQINEVTSRLIPLRATAVNAGEVIVNAETPTDPIRSPLLSRAAGVLAGSLLGLGVAAMLSRRDNRIRSASDVTRACDLPMLATVRFPGSRPEDEAADTDRFDRLRNNVLGDRQGVSVLQIAGPTRKGASGAVAMGLTRALARSHDSALLIIATMESQLVAAGDLTGRPGLAEVLRGDAALADVLVDVPGREYRLLGPGKETHDLNSLLQSARLHHLVDELKELSLPAVIETAGLARSAAAQSITSAVDAVVLVVERSATTSMELSEAARLARHMAAPAVGIVLAKQRRSGRHTTMPVVSAEPEPDSAPTPTDDPATSTIGESGAGASTGTTEFAAVDDNRGAPDPQGNGRVVRTRT